MREALVLLAVACVALAAVAHASARVAACTPGIKPGGRTYCGPARATLKVGGKRYLFRGGNCKISGGTWLLNIGTITLIGTPKHTYLGITVFSRKPGKRSAAVSWQLQGKTKSLRNAFVTLARGLRKGTFTGSVIPGGGKASGSFRCR